MVLAGCTSVLLLWVGPSAQNRPPAGTTTFVFDGNRMYAELGFVRPDGSIHRALAFVDMGSPTMTLRESLFTELQIDRDRPLVFRLGDRSIEVPRADVISEPRPPSSIGADLKVAAMLPASVLQAHQVVIDYGTRTLTLAPAGSLHPGGVAVPFQINRKTGLIAVDASIDGVRHAITIDNGSAYTWVRQSAAGPWLASHPDWKRGVGAVGASNMTMAGDGTESAGTLLRIPEMSIGALTLHDVGVLAAGPGRPITGDLDLFDWYSQKNPVPVIGWIGGNVLKAFQVTIDYPNRVMHWVKQREPDAHDLDQIGLTLRFDGGAFFVAAVATKNGTPTVVGVQPGDRLIRVGGVETSGATWGAIFDAMHGAPGDHRPLTLERDGRRFTVEAHVTAF
jgi:hypothetical protein